MSAQEQDLFEIREIGAREALESAQKILLRHFAALYGIAALSLLSISLFQTLIEIGLRTVLPLYDVGQDSLQVALLPIQILFSVIITFLSYPLLEGAVSCWVISRALGRPLTAMEALAEAWRVLPELVLVFFVRGVLTMLGVLFLLVPGIIVALMLSFVVPVVMIEGKCGLAPLGRSRTLMSGYYGRMFLVNLASFLIGMLIGFVTSRIPVFWMPAVFQNLLLPIPLLYAYVAMTRLYLSARREDPEVYEDILEPAPLTPGPTTG